MSNSTYSSTDDANLEEYETQTLTPQWGFAFEFTTGVWLILLCATFRPLVMFLRQQKRRRKQRIEDERKSGTCENPCTGESFMMFIAMPEDEDDDEEDAENYDDDMSHPKVSNQRERRRHDDHGDMAVEFTETVDCTASDMETILIDLDAFEHKETFEMIQHVTEDRTREELVPIVNTSVLHVDPPTRRQIIFYRTNGDDIDMDSDASVDTSSESDDEDSGDRFAVKYCLGYSWDEFELQYSNYRNVRWTCLPSAAMRAARTLGFDRKSWDSGQVAPVITSKPWNERDREEKAACEDLGIDEEQWNHDRDLVLSVDIPFRNWNELPRNAQLAATYLGYDKDKWDADDNPPCGEIPWKKLSEKQREACRVLGFNQKTWDNSGNQRQHAGSASSVSSVRMNKCQNTLSTLLAICELLALDHETLRLVKLAIPTTLIMIIIPILEGIKVASILIWMGPYQYLSWAISNYFLDWCDCLTAGFAEAEKILCAHAIGLKKYFLAGQYVQLTSLFHAMTAITCYGALVFFVGKILTVLDFGDNINFSVKEYIPLCATARLVRGSCIRGIERLLLLEGKRKPVLVFEVANRALQLLGIIIAVGGFQSQSLLTIGILEMCSAIFHVFLTYTLCSYGWLSKYEVGLFGNWAISNGSLARGILKMTWPLTIGRFLVHGEWQILTIFAAYMGPGETVVWTLAQALWGILKEFPSGMIIAAEARIRGKLRVGRPDLAKVVAYKSFLYIFLTAIIVDAIFVAIQEPLLSLLTQDATFREMANHLVTLMCVGNVMLAIGSNAHSILVTQHRAKTAVLIYYLSIFGVTIPMATWLAVGLQYGLDSLLMSCVFGYSFMTFCMLVFVFTTKWPKFRQQVLSSSRNQKGKGVSKRRRPVQRLTPVSDSVSSTKQSIATKT